MDVSRDSRYSRDYVEGRRGKDINSKKDGL